MTLSTVERRPPTGLTFDSKAGTDAVTLADTGAATEGTGPAILWAAQWRTPGTTAAHRLDNGAGGNRWSNDWGGSGSVVTAASTGISGWPTANVLRVPVAAGEGWCKLVLNTLPALAVGTTRYIRWYFAATHDDIRLAGPPGSPTDPQCHPCESGQLGLDEEYGMGQWFRDNSNGYIAPDYWGWSIMNDEGAGTNHYKEQTGPAWNAPIVQLPSYTVYRLELAINRISSTQHQLRARRYNAADVLEADENDLYANGNVLAGRTFTIGNPLTYTTWTMGTNQSTYMPVGSPPQSYQAAVAVSDEDWLGPYNAATEANWDTP